MDSDSSDSNIHDSGGSNSDNVNNILREPGELTTADIYGRLNDLNTRLVQLYEWVGTTLKDKIIEYDKENNQQNDRLNKLEYELLSLKKIL